MCTVDVAGTTHSSTAGCAADAATAQHGATSESRELALYLLKPPLFYLQSSMVQRCTGADTSPW
jgi:hypothetical protein